ncbi:MAG: amino acid permease [Nitrospiraceae bacterium]|nr:MAG: amino acid permease [Nitrospiraceae bacterium]
MRRAFRTKSIEQIHSDCENQPHKLKRTLTLFDLTALGIGAIIGTGIFVLVGTAAVGDGDRPGAGPALALSFVLSGAACLLAALCYAEFASMIPAAGSAYTYTYATLGELFAWITGWSLVLEYGIACVAVSIGWSGYLVSILERVGVHLPPILINAPHEGGLINLPAVLIVLALTVLLVIGIKESARVTGVIVVIKIAVVLFFITVGAFAVEPANWHPFMPNGFAGVGAAAAVIFFAYIGFDAVSTTAEEARNPQRDVPIGIILSLSICTVLYIAVALVLTGIVPYSQIHVKAPVAEALNQAGIRWGGALVATGAVAGITSVLIVMLLGQIRVFYAMSRDGLLWPWLSAVHPRYGTPHHATLITGVGVAILAGFVPIGVAAELTNIGTLFAFTLVCGAVLVLRKTRPDLKRAFRVPFVPLLPILGMAACLGLIGFLPPITWAGFLVWAVVGLILYAVYGFRHSKLGRQAPGANKAGS